MGQRRQDLLDAAAQLFQAHGVRATAVEDITRATGISKGAFYQHFDSKDCLIVELLQRFYDELLAQAAPAADGSEESPLAALKRMIAAELDVSTDYQNFLRAVAIDYPPGSAGPVPEAMDGLWSELHSWHEHVLLEVFGPGIRRYLTDLVVVLEGTIHHYLMTVLWQGCALPRGRAADFIAVCLREIVAGDRDLVPALSPTGPDEPGDPSIPERMIRELTAIRAAVGSAPRPVPAAEKDVATIDLLIEELRERAPREFLVDALLTQLHARPHLVKHLTSTTASWDVWKGSAP